MMPQRVGFGGMVGAQEGQDDATASQARQGATLVPLAQDTKEDAAWSQVPNLANPWSQHPHLCLAVARGKLQRYLQCAPRLRWFWWSRCLHTGKGLSSLDLDLGLHGFWEPGLPDKRPVTLAS